MMKKTPSTVYEAKLEAAVEDSARYAYCRSGITTCNVPKRGERIFKEICDNCTWAHKHYTRVTISQAVQNAKNTLERWGFTVTEREI